MYIVPLNACEIKEKYKKDEEFFILPLKDYRLLIFAPIRNVKIVTIPIAGRIFLESNVTHK